MISNDELIELLSTHGICRPQPVTDWTGSIPLPVEIARFYEEIGPMDIEIVGYGNPTEIPSLSALWDLQEGYRWHSRTKERFTDWPDEWIVVASESGDPFIFRDGKILFALHGTGKWETAPIFFDIFTMAACLGIVGKVVKEAGADIVDDNSVIRPKYRDMAIDHLREILYGMNDVLAVLDKLGW